MKYTKQQKEGIIQRMMAPNPTSIKELSKEEGISMGTLYNWRQEARRKGILLPDTDAVGWSAADKFAAVLESAPLNEHDFGAYCRRKGILPEQLKQWREACESANDWDRHANKRLKEERHGDRKEIRQLKAELQRKEKALAEAAALLVLQKKVQAIWEETEDE